MSISLENNLDYLAAKHAQEVVKAEVDEKTITKVLGVLQEDGVYACFLYIYAREKETGEKIIAPALALFKALEFSVMPNTFDRENTLKYVAEQITADLSRVLLAKQALEQMLIYARYGAKARS